MDALHKRMRGKLRGQVEAKLGAKLEANRTPDHDLQSNLAPTSVFNLLQVGPQVESQVGGKLGYLEPP